MAAYDSPGWTSAMPGIGGRDEWMTAAGSQASGLPDTSGPLSDRIQQGTTGNQAVVYGAFDSLATAAVVTVGPLDTLVPREADLYSGGDANPLSGLTGDAVGHTGAGQGAGHAPHPNSVSVPSLAAQAQAAARPQ